MELPNHVGDPLRHLLYAAGVLALVITSGTFGYVIIEGWSVFDGLYMTVTTITTVGYREVNPLSAAGRAIAFIPNEIGKALLHNERVTR